MEMDSRREKEEPCLNEQDGDWRVDWMHLHAPGRRWRVRLAWQRRSGHKAAFDDEFREMGRSGRGEVGGGNYLLGMPL